MDVDVWMWLVTVPKMIGREDWLLSECGASAEQ